ncbi:hypothetical protein COB64_02560 [Candidatus Wolfebacteria bacterium]|nr:MAG: hypothetical protein COB64_02560 [Candidatus Wolfebacteria bacterium]
MRQFKISKSITPRDSIVVNKYLKEVSMFPVLEINEEAIVARKARNGDKDSFDLLINSNLRFVVSVAKQYQNQGLSLPDLINEGNLGLIKAAQRFDETRGFRFISYAVWWIRQGIRAGLYDIGNAIRLPHNQISWLVKIEKTDLLLRHHLEREPSTKEIADELGWDENKILKTNKSHRTIFSLESSLNGNAEYSVRSLHDVIENTDSIQPDDVLLKESLSSEIEKRVSILPERDRRILLAYYGINREYKPTLEEVGEQFGITHQAVGYIITRSIRRLRRRKDIDVIDSVTPIPPCDNIFTHNGNGKDEVMEEKSEPLIEAPPKECTLRKSINPRSIYHEGIYGLIYKDITCIENARDTLYEYKFTYLADKLDEALKKKRFENRAVNYFLKDRPDIEVEVRLITEERGI